MTVQCIDCGTVFESNPDRLVNTYCEACADEHVTANPNTFNYKGKRYLIGEEPTAEQLAKHRSWYGFGGDAFEVTLANGKTIITHNLWHQGSTKGPDTGSYRSI